MPTPRLLSALGMLSPLAMLLLFLLLSLSSLLPLSADNTTNLSLYAKGVFAESRHDWATARENYQATLAKDPDSYPLVRKVFDLQTFRPKGLPSFADIPAATATLRTFSENNRKHLPAQLHYASFLRQQPSHDNIAQQAARETLELANQNFPHTSTVFSPLISFYEDRELRDDSLRILNENLQATTEAPHHWLALIPLIKTLYPADDPQYSEKLAHAMGKLAAHGLHRSDIARRVSEYHREQGQLTQALAPLEKHLALSPSSHSLRTRLGLLQLSNKDEAAGEGTLLDVIAIDPDQSLAHSSLAKLYRQRNDPLRALSHQAEVLRINGSQPSEAIQIANEYLAHNQPHPARLLLEKIRFDHPDNPGIHARLAIATSRDGLPTKALRLFRQTETLAAESPQEDDQQHLDADFQLEFAQSLIATNDLPAAEARLRQAAQGLNLDAEPQKYARTVTALAKLWLDQDKNHAPARALLQRAVMLDPQNEKAASLLK